MDVGLQMVFPSYGWSALSDEGTPDHILHMFDDCRAIVGDFALATSDRFGGTPFDLANARKTTEVAQAAE